MTHVPGHIGPHRPFVSPEEFISRGWSPDVGMQMVGGIPFSPPSRAEIAANPLTPWIPGVSTATYWPEMGPWGRSFSTGMDIADLLSLGWASKLTSPITSRIRSGITDAASRFRPAQPVKNTPLGPHSWYGPASPEAKKAIEEAYDTIQRIEELKRLDPPLEFDAAVASQMIKGSPNAPMRINPPDFTVQRGVQSQALPDQFLPGSVYGNKPTDLLPSEIYSGPEWLHPLPRKVAPKTWQDFLIEKNYGIKGVEEVIPDVPLFQPDTPRIRTRGFGEAQDVIPSVENPYTFTDYVNAAKGEVPYSTVPTEYRSPERVLADLDEMLELVSQRQANLDKVKIQAGPSIPSPIPPAPMKDMYWDLNQGGWSHPYNARTRALVNQAGTLPFTMPTRGMYFNELME